MDVARPSLDVFERTGNNRATSPCDKYSGRLALDMEHQTPIDYSVNPHDNKAFTGKQTPLSCHKPLLRSIGPKAHVVQNLYCNQPKLSTNNQVTVRFCLCF